MQLFLSPTKFQSTEFRVLCKIGFALRRPAPKNKQNKTKPNPMKKSLWVQMRDR
jgi:hypothetical protein